MSTPPNPHTSLVAVQTAGPHRVIVEPADGAGSPVPIGRPGAWFRMWESTVFSGLLSRMSGGECRMFWVLAAHHQRDGGRFCIVSDGTLCRLMGRSLIQVRSIRRALCARDGGRICVHHGGSVYELMPDEPLLGRRTPDGHPGRCAWTLDGAPLTALGGAPPGGGKPAPVDEKPSGEDGKPAAAPRAKPSPKKEEKNRSPRPGLEHPPAAPRRDPRIADAAAARWGRAERAGKGGWAGFPLWWDLAGVSDVRLCLALLEVREPALGECVGGLTDLTVEEIDRQARDIADQLGTRTVDGGPAVRRPALLLLNRLYARRGQEPPYRKRIAERIEAREAAGEAIRRLSVLRSAQAAGTAGGDA